MRFESCIKDPSLSGELGLMIMGTEKSGLGLSRTQSRALPGSEDLGDGGYLWASFNGREGSEGVSRV